MLWFAHGWGFDSGLWNEVLAAPGSGATAFVDRGYFGDSLSPLDDGGPVIAVGHSLGVLHLLRRMPSNCAGLIAINGFDRFAGEAGDPTAVPGRIVQRMLTRFREQPDQVLGDFRRRCGSDEPVPDEIRPETLIADLGLLRIADERAASARLGCPILVLHGDEDAILPPAMRGAVFSGCAEVERHQLRGHGHLLPKTAASWCADHIRAFADRVGMAV